MHKPVNILRILIGKMKKPIFSLSVILFIAVLSFTFNNSLANHIAAVNITYQGIDTFQYIVTVRIYRDCRNPNYAPPGINVKYKSASCAYSGSATLPLITGNSTGTPGTGNYILLPCGDSTSCLTATTDRKSVV